MTVDDAQRAIDHAIGEHVDEIGPRRMEQLLQIRAQDMRKRQAGENLASLEGSPKVDRLEGDAEDLGVDEDVKRTNAHVLDPGDVDDADDEDNDLDGDALAP